MGAWIYHNHINISDKPLTYDMGAYIYYKDIDENFINEVVGNPMIQCIQIDGIYGSFPDEVYPVIDKILEKREGFSFCKVIHTNQMLWIKNEFIYLKNKHFYCLDDYIDHFITVHENEDVKVIGLYGKFAYIIKNKEIGWIESGYLEKI